MSDGELAIPTRRSYMRYASTAVSAAAVGAGATGTAAAADASSYERVVDVTEAGADPDGEENITPVLRDNMADDTLFRFPEGEYLMTEQLRWTGFENVGFEGNDATIVPGSYHTHEGEPRCFKLGTYKDPGNKLRFEGIDFDFSGDETGVRAIQAQVDDDLLVRDVTVHGEHDSGTWGPFLFDVTDPDGDGWIRRVRLPDGGEYSRHAPGNANHGPIGILVSRFHEGHIRFRDCVVGGFPDNGLYARNGAKTYVIGGEYRNSNVASIRIGGDGSLVHGATVVVDENRDDDVTQIGIRLDRGEYLRVRQTSVDLQEPNGCGIKVLNDCDSAVIRDCSVSVQNRKRDAIRVNPGAGETDILDTEIRQDTSGRALDLRQRRDGGGPVTVEYVTVTGDGDGSSNRHVIYCGRDGTEFRANDVQQDGGDWRRCILLAADDCLVYKGSYRSEHHPLVNAGSNNRFIEIEEVEAFNGSEGLLLHGGNEDVDVIRNTVHEGVRDKGTEDLTMYGNEFP
jgi:hypothetical protein